MKLKSRKLIVVLGMHRSGTSATTRGLEVLGVNLGGNLHPAAVDNPTGFWEDRDFLSINEALLVELSSGSDRLGLVDWKMPNASATESLRRQAEELVRVKSEENALWGFKDPRTARLLPFWQSVFEKVDCEPHYLLVTRNPLSIAKSLYERNGVEAEKSYYLWLEHVVPAVLRIVHDKRLVVDFDRLMENPERELLRVARAFGLPAPAPLALSSYKNEFLKDGLRHTHFTSDHLFSCLSVPPQVFTAYDWLVKLANDDSVFDSSEMKQAFTEISRELVAFAPALNCIDRLEQKAVRISRIENQREELVTALQAQLENLQSDNASLTSQRDEWEKFGSQCEQTIVALTSQLNERDAAVALQEAKLNKIRSHWLVRLVRLVSSFYNSKT